MSWQRVDLADLQFERPTEPPAICGLVYRGKRHALSGPPEAAKTLAALIFGLEQMRAGDGTFAIVDFEMGEHATRLLLQDLGASIDEIRSVFYVNPAGPPEQADLDAISAAEVTLAIIDAAAGAYDATGLDDNKRADAEMFSRRWITPLWRLGITTIILDHVVKNSDLRGRYAIGSERKLGTVDVHLGLEPVRHLHRGASGLVRIVTHKDRPGHLPRPRAAELELHSDPGTHRISWEFKPASQEEADDSSDGWRPTVLMDRVLEYLAKQAEPVSCNTVAGAVRGQRSYIMEAIRCLAIDGTITEQAGARGARLVGLPNRFVVRRRTTHELVVGTHWFPHLLSTGRTSQRTSQTNQSRASYEHSARACFVALFTRCAPRPPPGCENREIHAAARSFQGRDSRIARSLSRFPRSPCARRAASREAWPARPDRGRGDRAMALPERGEDAGTMTPGYANRGSTGPNPACLSGLAGAWRRLRPIHAPVRGADRCRAAGDPSLAHDDRESILVASAERISPGPSSALVAGLGGLRRGSAAECARPKPPHLTLKPHRAGYPASRISGTDSIERITALCRGFFARGGHKLPQNALYYTPSPQVL